MAVTDFAAADPRLIKIIERYMESLRRSADGDDLYALIARGLRRFAAQGPTSIDCITYLHAQLDAYARDPIALPNVRIKARLLQQHLATYLPEEQTIPDTPAPKRNGSDVHGDAPAQANAEAPQIAYAAAACKTAQDAANPIFSTPPPDSSPVTHAGLGQEREPAEEKPVEGVLERMEKSEPEGLDENKRGEEYQALLRSERDTWRAIYGTVRDFNKLKRLWMSSLDELAKEGEALEQKLGKTTEYLKSVEAERDRLRVALDNAQQGASRNKRAGAKALSKTNARGPRRPAPLPRRDAFIKQLEAEIERVKRTGHPLALALIGVNDLEAVKDKYGDGADQAVLKCYAREILSGFRVYDLIGRYDHDRFAVLLPDTLKDGAVRALEKIQKRASETHISHAGKSFSLPGFASVMTTYVAGEDPDVLLRRVDAALGEIRTSGRQGVTVA